MLIKLTNNNENTVENSRKAGKKAAEKKQGSLILLPKITEVNM